MVALPARALLVPALLALAAVPALGEVQVNQPPCPGTPEPVLFAGGLDRLENLLFDGHGNLFVTSIDGELRRFAADGSMDVLLEGDVPLGGLTLRDGVLYLGYGVGPPLTAWPGAATTEVWAFTSLDPPVHTVYATGLLSSNGLLFGPDGSLFVGGGFDPWLWRVPPGGGVAERWADLFTPNGLAPTPDGEGLYAVLSLDPTSSIVRVAYDDPEDQTTVAQLSLAAATVAPVGVNNPPDVPSVVWKGLDDLAVGPHGDLYPTAHISGEALRVDAHTGEACVLASGFHETSSARFATGFAPFDGDLFISEFGGKLWRLPSA